VTDGAGGVAGSGAPPSPASPATPATLGALAADLRARFRAAGLETAALDARLLSAASCGVAPDRVVLSPDRAISEEERARADSYARRRLSGEPVGRILGEREFWGLTFALSADTLEPRPDTETLVEAALTWCDARGGRARPWRFADLGTGTGAIAVALLSELPAARAVAVDISQGALATARANARRHAVSERFLPMLGDFAQALAPGLDFIVSNPPYVAETERADLSVDVRGHDPQRALFAGADGLDAYRAILPEGTRVLAETGAVLLEIGAAQGQAVSGLARAAGFADTGVIRDLAGRDRVVRAGSVANPRQRRAP